MQKRNTTKAEIKKQRDPEKVARVIKQKGFPSGKLMGRTLTLPLTRQYISVVSVKNYFGQISSADIIFDTENFY